MKITIIGEAILIILQTWKSGVDVVRNVINIILALVAGVPEFAGVGKVIEAVLAAWAATGSEADKLVAAVLALIANVPGILSGVALKAVLRIAASFQNFQTGQAAVVDVITVPEEISGVPGGRKASFVLFYNDGPVGEQVFGLGGNPPTPAIGS